MVLLSFGFSWKSNRIYPLRLFFTNQPLTPYLHSQNLLTLSLKKGFQDSDGTHLYKRQNGLWCNSLSRLSYSNSKEERLKESHFELLLGTWQSLWSFLKVSDFDSLWVDRKNSHERLLYSKYERCLGSCQLVYGPCHFDRFWYRVL